MKKSKQLYKAITKLVEASFKEGKVVENQVIKSVKILKSQPNYEAIWALSEYLRELKRKMREYTMYIETAYPLTLRQVVKAKKIVSQKVKITQVKVTVNPTLLGGFKLKIGDEIWDESILGKIDQVKEAIVHGRPN